MRTNNETKERRRDIQKAKQWPDNKNVLHVPVLLLSYMDLKLTSIKAIDFSVIDQKISFRLSRLVQCVFLRNKK